MPGDCQLLISGNDEDVDGTVAIVDKLAGCVICSGIDMHAEPREPCTDLAADLLAMLADAAGEDQAVQSLKRVRHRRDLLRRPEGEEIDRLPRRGRAAREQRAHVRGYAGDPEQA